MIMYENPIATFAYFSGLNTVDDPTRISPDTVQIQNVGYKAVYPLTVAENVDIDNTNAISSRLGSTLKLSGSSIHSLWSNGVVALFADGKSLYKLNKDYTSILLIKSGLSGLRIVYEPVVDRVYFTDGQYIGYYKDNTIYDIAAPTAKYGTSGTLNMNFKAVLPAGQFLSRYKTKLLVGKGKVLYMADSLSHHYDVRRGYRTFGSDIKMIHALDTGIYISDSDYTYFLSEKEMGEEIDVFTREKVIDCPAMPYTDITIDGKYVGEGQGDDVVMWTSKDGICMGDGNGKVESITRNNYIVDDHSRGAAFLRNNNNVVHYIVALE